MEGRDKMELTKKEKDVLSLMDEITLDGFVGFVKKVLNYPNKDIKIIANKLVKFGFVKIIDISQTGKSKKWYFHTKKVSNDMINDNLRYIKEMGSKFGKGKKNGPINKLRKFIKK
jgi:hypothetical protein